MTFTSFGLFLLFLFCIYLLRFVFICDDQCVSDMKVHVKEGYGDVTLVTTFF